jgi:hypothetical protein
VIAPPRVTYKRRRLPHTSPGATSAEVVFQAVPRHKLGDQHTIADIDEQKAAPPATRPD